jgi:hypothetical protein
MGVAAPLPDAIIGREGPADGVPVRAPRVGRINELSGWRFQPQQRGRAGAPLGARAHDACCVRCLCTMPVCVCAHDAGCACVHVCVLVCVCVWAGDSREFLLTRGGMSGVCGGGPRLLRGLQLSPAPSDAAAHPHIAGEAPHTEPPRRYDATRVAGRADRRAADGAHGEVRLPSGRHCLSKGVPRASPAVSLPHRHARRCCLRGV